MLAKLSVSQAGIELGKKRCRYGNNNHQEILTIPVPASGSSGMAYHFIPSHFEPWPEPKIIHPKINIFAINTVLKRVAAPVTEHN